VWSELSAALNARSQMAGRNYPFATFLPRFWLQEIVEELDNSTTATSRNTAVRSHCALRRLCASLN